MSKVDAQRALRDARYARFAAQRAADEAAAAKKPARGAPKTPAKSRAAGGADVTGGADPTIDVTAAEPPAVSDVVLDLRVDPPADEPFLLTGPPPTPAAEPGAASTTGTGPTTDADPSSDVALKPDAGPTTDAGPGADA